MICKIVCAYAYVCVLKKDFVAVISSQEGCWQEEFPVYLSHFPSLASLKSTALMLSLSLASFLLIPSQMNCSLVFRIREAEPGWWQWWWQVNGKTAGGKGGGQCMPRGWAVRKVAGASWTLPEQHLLGGKWCIQQATLSSFHYIEGMLKEAFQGRNWSGNSFPWILHCYPFLFLFGFIFYLLF